MSQMVAYSDWLMCVSVCVCAQCVGGAYTSVAQLSTYWPPHFNRFNGGLGHGI